MAKEIKYHEKYTVNMTQNAENDLNEIMLFISQNSPQTALKIMEEIQARINMLDHSPNRGSYVPELLARNIKEYRQITEHPWKTIYKVNDEVVNVLAIIDSRRNLQDILIRKLI
jgi:plasmid stabilization system protein ParE